MLRITSKASGNRNVGETVDAVAVNIGARVAMITAKI
jgi:hypothetical protein